MDILATHNSFVFFYNSLVSCLFFLSTVLAGTSNNFLDQPGILADPCTVLSRARPAALFSETSDTMVLSQSLSVCVCVCGVVLCVTCTSGCFAGAGRSGASGCFAGAGRSGDAAMAPTDIHQSYYVIRWRARKGERTGATRIIIRRTRNVAYGVKVRVRLPALAVTAPQGWLARRASA